ncbi:hypothetical protein [Mongoliitalea daihaiensis]|uniref:hypothetical protein n=1 Tax=Mongoliitalea daihaiensis TaxID=2782006 RepID=UPI001F1D2E95|nr:hypothetical protein [Mongoliitalea daihaiensis]UJP65945.1 hypothetical protein IPZ59_04795 [Mongoliitalea daihaiensis]
MKNLKLSMFALMGMMVLLFSCNDSDDQAPMLRMQTFEYNFNEGQLVGAATAYVGEHPRNLTARMVVEEQAGGMAKITVTLNNTLSGRMYMIHAHDAADPATTPNGTPYNEAPNSNVLSAMVTPQGSTAMVEHQSTLSYEQIINNYEGFLVVHDPTQDISTTDLTTYLILGLFAR